MFYVEDPKVTTMGKKERTGIYLDREIKKRAIELGLNISQVCENALKALILTVNSTFKRMEPGFEPGSTAERAGPRNLKGLRPPEPTTGVQIPPAAPFPFVSTSSEGLSPHQAMSEEGMTKFREFLEVDLQREPRTVYGHVWQLLRFREWLGDRDVTRDVIREYLLYLKRENPGEYKNSLSALKVYFRDYVGRGDLVATFKFPGKEIPVKRIPGAEKLRRFHEAAMKLDLRLACFFLLYATSGWRFLEVFSLHREDADLEARMLTHRLKSTSTKGRLPGFFNEEAQALLRRWMSERRDSSPKLLPINRRRLRLLWKQAEEEAGVQLKPQDLREWFCEAMGNLRVRDRYIDAFCGRVPKTVLAKHYTDYLPEKLKRIYDKAGLRVLS